MAESVSHQQQPLETPEEDELEEELLEEDEDDDEGHSPFIIRALARHC